MNKSKVVKQCKAMKKTRRQLFVSQVLFSLELTSTSPITYTPHSQAQTLSCALNEKHDEPMEEENNHTIPCDSEPSSPSSQGESDAHFMDTDCSTVPSGHTQISMSSSPIRSPSIPSINCSIVKRRYSYSEASKDENPKTPQDQPIVNEYSKLLAPLRSKHAKL